MGSFEPFIRAVVARVEDAEAEADEYPIEEGVEEEAKVIKGHITPVTPHVHLAEQRHVEHHVGQLDATFGHSEPNVDQHDKESPLELAEEDGDESVAEWEGLPEQDEHHDEQQPRHHHLDRLSLHPCTRK